MKSHDRPRPVVETGCETRIYSPPCCSTIDTVRSSAATRARPNVGPRHEATAARLKTPREYISQDHRVPADNDTRTVVVGQDVAR